MDGKKRLIITIALGLVTLIALGALVAEAVLAGSPRPVTMALALASAALTIAWPLATQTRPQWIGPVCLGCRETAIGVGEFGFCVRCGSTRTARAGSFRRS